MVTIIKEWKEFYRSSLWIMTVGLIVLSAGFILFQYQGMEIPVSFRTGLIPVFQTSLYFLPLLAMVYGAFAMSLEKTQRTLPILLARGVSVRQFVWKKFLSLFAVFLATIAVSYLIAMIPAKMFIGKLVVGEFLIFLFSIILLSAIFIAIGIVLGSFINQKLKLIGAIIGIWLALIYLFDLVLMYWLPTISIDGVLGFSIVYFLSPVHAVQYFLFVKLNVYQLSDMSVMYEQFTFQSPWLVLVVNALFWIGIAFAGTMYALKRKGVTHD